MTNSFCYFVQVLDRTHCDTVVVTQVLEEFYILPARKDLKCLMVTPHLALHVRMTGSGQDLPPYVYVRHIPVKLESDVECTCRIV